MSLRRYLFPDPGMLGLLRAINCKLDRLLKTQELDDMATKETLDALTASVKANTNATAAAKQALDGYVKSNADLTAQRDHYLPLKVIRAELDAQPDGELPPFGSPYGVPRLVSVTASGGDSAGLGAGSDPAAVGPTRVRLSREDLLERSGVDGELLTALLKSGVITTGPGGFFDEHAVVILQCARALSEYGVEPRHLRAFRSAADRQSDLIAQIAGPVVKADKAGARDRADDLAREVAALAITLHTSLIKSAVRDVLHR